jgi:frizzled protein 1/7
MIGLKKTLKYLFLTLIIYYSNTISVNAFSNGGNNNNNNKNGIISNTNGAIIGEDYQLKPNEKCEKISMKMCSDIPYNMTFYPNSLKHQTQGEAEMDLKQFEMLANVKCSPDVKFFLCTIYAPVCTQMDFALPPCQHLCLSAKNGCESLMLKFGFKWPEMFNCNKFPESGMCVGENRTSAGAHGTGSSMTNGKQKNGSKLSSKALLPELECPHTMKILSKNRYHLKIANQTIEQCSLPCGDDNNVPVFFDDKIRNLLRFWTGLGAVLSCITSGLTLLTFLVNLKRFEFPERSILYLSFCTFVVSGVYVYGMIYENGFSCASSSVAKISLVTQAMDNPGCTLVAVIHYYFSMSMYLWWLSLTFSWFLVTTLKWGEAPVGFVFSSYFHIFAWGLPLILVIMALVFHAIDGDMFASICSVGNLQPQFLFHFVVIPEAIALAIGFIFFLIGLVSCIRIRSYIKCQPKYGATEKASENLFLLMTRMTMFVLFFAIASSLSIFAQFYQTIHLEEWLTSWYSTRCLHAKRASFGFTQSRETCPLISSTGSSLGGSPGLSGSGIPSQILVGNLISSEPSPLLYFSKHLQFFIIGFSCAIWIFNGKTFQSFRDCWDRQCHRGRSRVPTVDH